MEPLYRAAFEEASDAILLFSSELHVLMANRAAEALLGYAEGELIGRAALELVDPTTLREQPLRVEELRRTGVLRSQRRLIRKDGSTVEVDAASRLMPDGRTVTICRDDSERKRVLTELETSRAWFQAILEHAYDGVLIASEDGRIRYLSPNAQRILGFPLSGTSGFDLLHPDDVPKMVELHQKVLAHHGEHHRVLARIRDPAGVRTMEITVVNLLRDPVVAGLLANFREVTDRIATEQRFESVVSVLSEGIIIQERSGAIVYANESASPMIGLSMDRMIRQEGTAFTAETYPIAITLRTGEPQQNVIMAYDSKDGDLRWVSVNSAPLRDGSGAVTGAVASFFDITSQKESEARLSRVLRGAADGFWDVDLVGGDSYFSDRALEMFGYPRGEWGHAKFRESLHAEDRERVLAVQDAHGRGEVEIYEAEYRLRRKDGAYIWVRDRGRVVERDANGRATRVAGSVADVTDRRKLEAQYLHAQKMESIGRLAGGIAHDFNNLLTVILGYARMLEDKLSGEDATDVGQIIRAGERAAALTQQILAFSRKQVLAPADVDLNQLVGRLLEMIERVIGETIQVDFIPGRDLGNIYADPTQIEQVLMNLCVNSKDAMPAGGRITIETENVLINGNFIKTHPWAKRGRYVLLSISDAGHGIPAEELQQIFEPFFTTKPAGKGTGLGLATVYGIVKQHDGLITVYSEVGTGTTFKIYLPIQIRQASTIGPKLEPSISGGSETILVAEDQGQVRALVARVLTEAGYRVILAKDGLDALEKFEEHCGVIDLVIADVIMPKVSGKDLIVEIRRRIPTIPFILTTGYTSESLTELTDDERNRLVLKPYDPDLLLRKLREVLDSTTR